MAGWVRWPRPVSLARRDGLAPAGAAGRTPGCRCISGWPGSDPGRRASSRWPGQRQVGGQVGGQARVDGQHPEFFLRAHGVDRGDDGGALLVQHEQGFGAALGGLGRGRVRESVRGGSRRGLCRGCSPARRGWRRPRRVFLLQRQPEVFGDVLLGAPPENGGRVGAVQVDRLIGGEQQNPGLAELAFQFQGVEGVPAAAFDVLTYDGGEPGSRVGASASRSAGPRRGAGPCPRTAGQCGSSHAARCPGRRTRCPSSRRRGRTRRDHSRAEVMYQGDEPVGVLEFQGGGAAQHRHRQRLGPALPPRVVFWVVLPGGDPPDHLGLAGVQDLGFPPGSWPPFPPGQSPGGPFLCKYSEVL